MAPAISSNRIHRTIPPHLRRLVVAAADSA
jgi:hypothetical protein